MSLPGLLGLDPPALPELPCLSFPAPNSLHEAGGFIATSGRFLWGCGGNFTPRLEAGAKVKCLAGIETSRKELGEVALSAPNDSGINGRAGFGSRDPRRDEAPAGLSDGKWIFVSQDGRGAAGPPPSLSLCVPQVASSPPWLAGGFWSIQRLG